MRKKKTNIPETEYGKLLKLLGMYERILHPDIFQPLLKQFNAACEEAKQQSYRDARISEEALQVERIIISLRKDIVDKAPAASFLCKCAYKEILKIFLNGIHLPG